MIHNDFIFKTYAGWTGMGQLIISTKLNPNPCCYYNRLTRNDSRQEIFATMSETLVNFVKFSHEQIKVDFQYQVWHWPYAYCSNGSWSFLRTLSSTNKFRFLMATLFSFYNIDIDSLNPIFQRKTKLHWLLKKNKLNLSILLFILTGNQSSKEKQLLWLLKEI